MSADDTLRNGRGLWVGAAGIDFNENLLTDPGPGRGGASSYYQNLIGRAFALGILEGGGALKDVMDRWPMVQKEAPASARGMLDVADEMYSNAVDDGAVE